MEFLSFYNCLPSNFARGVRYLRIRIESNLFRVVFLILTLAGSSSDFSILAQQDAIDAIHPGDQDSHLRFIERADSDHAQGLDDILEIYRRHLEEHPDDVSGHVEYCQFLEYAFLDEFEEVNTKQEQLDAALETINDLFPNDPIVQLYRCSNLYGEELESAILQLSQDGFPGWSDSQQAQLYYQLTWDRYHSMDYERVGETALKVLALDSSLNLTIPLARFYLEREQPREALFALTRLSGADEDRWQRGTRASMLVECEAYADAVRVYADIEETLSVYQLIEYAKALEEVRAIDGARNRFKLAVTNSWSSIEPHEEWFHFEMRQGNRELAIESYQNMMDQIENADLLLRHRFDLMQAHPDIPWHDDNLWGVFMVSAVIVILICLPLVWIIPIQWWGLRRVLSGKTDTQREFFWSMRHFWWASVLYLLTSVVIVYWFDYHGFADFWNDDDQYEYVFPYHDNPKTLVLFLITLGVGIFVTMRFRHWKLISTNRLSFKHSVLAVCLGWLGLLSIGRLIRAFDLFGVGLVDWGGGDFMAVSHLGKALIALNNFYGPVVLFGLIAILVPLYEEIIFRGMILDSCQRYFPFYLVNTFQAALFMVIHDNVSFFPVFFLMGLLAGILRQQSGGLLLPICLHMLNNGFACLPLILKTLR